MHEKIALTNVFSHECWKIYILPWYGWYYRNNLRNYEKKIKIILEEVNANAAIN